MGTRDELRAMIQTCRGAGVRVYADVVINHMVNQGTGKGFFTRALFGSRSLTVSTDVQTHRAQGDHGCRYNSGHNATDGSPYYTSG